MAPHDHLRQPRFEKPPRQKKVKQKEPPPPPAKGKGKARKKNEDRMPKKPPLPSILPLTPEEIAKAAKAPKKKKPEPESTFFAKGLRTNHNVDKWQ